MTIREYKDEIINYVENSSDLESLIISTFIAGMQAKKNISIYQNDEDLQPPKSMTNPSA